MCILYHIEHMQWKEDQKKIRRFKRTDGLTQYFEGGCYLLNWQTRVIAQRADAAPRRGTRERPGPATEPARRRPSRTSSPTAPPAPRAAAPPHGTTRCACRRGASRAAARPEFASLIFLKDVSAQWRQVRGRICRHNNMVSVSERGYSRLQPTDVSFRVNPG